MKSALYPTILASALLFALALPAAATPEGPPSFIMQTEQAYVMTPLSAFLGAGMGGAGGATLLMRNGLGSNTEWWLEGTSLGLNPFQFGTDVGVKYQYMQSPGGLAGAIYGALTPAYNGTFSLGANVGLPFSYGLPFGNFSFSPNLALGNVTAGLTTAIDFNLALIVPIGGGWLGTIQDIPALGLGGANGFNNDLAIGARFVPANNTAVDITIANLAGGNLTAGILGISAYAGF